MISARDNSTGIEYAAVCGVIVVIIIVYNKIIIIINVVYRNGSTIPVRRATPYKIYNTSRRDNANKSVPYTQFIMPTTFTPIYTPVKVISCASVGSIISMGILIKLIEILHAVRLIFRRLRKKSFIYASAFKLFRKRNQNFKNNFFPYLLRFTLLYITIYSSIYGRKTLILPSLESKQVQINNISKYSSIKK